MNIRGIKATELVNKINELVDKYGDTEIFINKNGNIRPIYSAEYYLNEKYIELI